MASILDVQLDSDDDDEEYIDEGASSSPSDNERISNQPPEKIRQKSRKTRVQRDEGRNSRQVASSQKLTEKRLSNIKLLFNEMREESLEKNRHQPAVNKEDFMLQFQRRYPKPSGKRNATPKDLLHHVNISVSAATEKEEQIGIIDFKKRFREGSGADFAESIKKAIEASYGDNLPGAQVKVATDYYYAGRRITLEKVVQKDSIAHRNASAKASKAEAKSIGGQFVGIDQYINELDNATAVVSSIVKSQADWESYKQDKLDSLQLDKSESYLEKQAFLRRAEWKEHTNHIEKKR